MKQLGYSYEGVEAVKDFKKEIQTALQKVKSAYPFLKTGDVIGGFSVLPSSGLPKLA